MKKFWWSALYLALISLLSNVAAGFVSRHFRTDVFPFRCYKFERGGRIYDKLRIRRWKDRVPDMSKFLRSLPRKVLDSRKGSAVKLLIQETCVAEIVHAALILLSFAVFLWWRDRWAVLTVALYDIVGNLPFILIQRYNRPRLVHLAEKLERTKEAAAEHG